MFFESLSNPTLEVIDIRGVSDLAHAVGAFVVVDNVFATPVLQRSADLGADVVVYSATKHIDGQGRALGGVILGTRDFIRGRPGWAVSVALISGGRPLIGTLCAPARGETWQAVAGQGAFRNGQPLSASMRREFAGSRVPAHALPKTDTDLVTVDQPNSIALRIAMVAADEADLVATVRWGFEWDIAAAGMIAREAGAAVSDAYGNKLDYNKRDPRAFGVLVSAPDIHTAAVARLAQRLDTQT